MKNFVSAIILCLISGHAIANSNSVSVCGMMLSQDRLKIAYSGLSASGFIAELNERADIEGTKSRVVASCKHSIAGQFAVVFVDADKSNSFMLFSRK